VTYYDPGSVAPFVQGEIDHDGSVSASRAASASSDRLRRRPGAAVLIGKVSVDAAVEAESAPLFFLDDRTLQPLRTEGSRAVLEGTTVKLKDEAATLLNDTFGTDTLAGGWSSAW
jgi:hypothetical protein